MENTFKGTDKEWFAVNFGGYINIQDGPLYEDNNILDQDKVGDDIAEANAQLIIHALPMLRELIKEVDILESMGLGDTDRCIRKKKLIKSATTIK